MLLFRKAEASIAAGMTDPSSSQCLFKQTFDVLKGHNVREFRCNTSSSMKMFGVKFVGEDGIDVGGLFRCAAFSLHPRNHLFGHHPASFSF